MRKIRDVNRKLIKRSTGILGFAAVILSVTVPINLLSGIKPQQPARSESIGLSTRDAFVAALITASVPGGVVWKQSCSGAEPKIQSSKQLASFSKTLDSIVEKDTQYRWVSDKGTVNLVPRSGEPPLLKIRIREFRTAERLSLNLILEKLLALPEIKNGATRLCLNRGLELLVGPSRSDPLKMEV